MSTTYADQPPSDSVAKSWRRFWRKLSQALERYLARRARWTVSEAKLRQTKHEIVRCRRLMHRPSETVAVARKVAGTRRSP